MDDPDAVYYVPEQEWIVSSAVMLLAIAAVLIVLTALRLLLARYSARGRDFLIAEYEPPADINIMVAAHLVGRSRAAVPAQLLQLAVNGNIRVLDRALRRGRTSYALQFVTAEGTDHLGTLFLQAIFGENPTPGTVREVRASNGPLRSNVAAVSSLAFGEARERGWRRRASLLQWLIVVAAGVLMLYTLLAAAFFYLVQLFSPLFVCAFFGAIAALVFAILSIRFFGSLTEEGAVMRDRLVGVRMYLELAEEQRLQMLQGALTAERRDAAGAAVIIRVYEKLLPYAVVWGVERSWISQLVGNAIDLDAAPEWLSDVNALSFEHASRRINSRLDSLVSSMRTQQERESPGSHVREP